MDKTAAVSAIPLETESALYCPEKIFLIPEYPIPAPVIANATERIMEACDFGNLNSLIYIFVLQRSTFFHNMPPYPASFRNSRFVRK